MQYLELDFLRFSWTWVKVYKIYISCSKHTFYINRMPISYSAISSRPNFNLTICKNVIGLQRSIGPKKGAISNLKNS